MLNMFNMNNPSHIIMEPYLMTWLITTVTSAPHLSFIIKKKLLVHYISYIQWRFQKISANLLIDSHQFCQNYLRDIYVAVP